ncbi:MAG: type I phosphomannose isomerase catalytic subunit [Opitutales bacterium]
MSVLTFKPIYQERVWGGRGLEEKLGRSLPDDQVIGESWEVVDREEAQSVIDSGPLKGKTLRAVIEADPAGVMGPGYDPKRPFPILVKWLDCQQRLSLQVHPPAAIAHELNGEPKTENWYIAASRPDSGLIVGLKRGVTRDQFEQGIKEETLEELVHRFPVEPGDSILVESGRIHAIDAGNLILEIQQNSDTTYRVYDWGRKGLDGKPRELHVEASLKSIDFQDFEPEPMKTGDNAATLADCDEFRIRKEVLSPGGQVLTLDGGQGPQMIHVVEGAITLAESQSAPLRVERGTNAVLTHGPRYAVMAAEPATILVTDRFV